MDMKFCKFCNRDLPIDDFHFQAGRQKRRTKCKDCQSAYYHDYKNRNHDSLKEKWSSASKRHYTNENRRAKTLKRYSITVADYDIMLASQNGKCGICLSETKLVVDHDHDTGAVRGLLCSECNLGLGKFKDDLDLLKMAVKYVAGTSLGGWPAS